MKRKTVLEIVVIAVLVLGSMFVRPAAQAYAGGFKILTFDSMVGVPAGLTAAQNKPILGVNGGGRPWVIGNARGELFTDGKLEIKFQGLVFDPSDPGVIAAGLANRNTVANMKAIVACTTADGSVAYAQTPLFPVTTGDVSQGGGTGMIETTLSLPSPCFAPVVFITSPGGNWFAVTGR